MTEEAPSANHEQDAVVAIAQDGRGVSLPWVVTPIAVGACMTFAAIAGHLWGHWNGFWTGLLVNFSAAISLVSFAFLLERRFVRAIAHDRARATLRIGISLRGPRSQRAQILAEIAESLWRGMMDDISYDVEVGIFVRTSIVRRLRYPGMSPWLQVARFGLGDQLRYGRFAREIARDPLGAALARTEALLIDFDKLQSADGSPMELRGAAYVVPFGSARGRGFVVVLGEAATTERLETSGSVIGAAAQIAERVLTGRL